MEQKLSNSEKRTAYILTLPAVCLVFAIILFPIFANIWISFKEVQLKDIRIPEPRAKEIIKTIPDEQNKIKIVYVILEIGLRNIEKILKLFLKLRISQKSIKKI